MDHPDIPRPPRRPRRRSACWCCRAAARSAPTRPAPFRRCAAHDFEPEWIAGISIGAINAAIIAGNPREKRVERLKEFWEMVSSPVSWNPMTPGRPCALAVQRDQRRADRHLRRARLLHAARAAGAAVAAGQPAIAELLRHRAAEEDAGAAGRFRPHQRSARRGSASAPSAWHRAISNISTISSSRSSARRSGRSTSWRPARCRRAFLRSRSRASIIGTAASPPTRRSITCWTRRSTAIC